MSVILHVLETVKKGDEMYIQGDNIRVTEAKADELVRLFPGKFSTNGMLSVLSEQEVKNLSEEVVRPSNRSALIRLHVVKSIRIGNTNYSEGTVIEALKMEAWSLFSRFPEHFSNKFGDLTPREIETFKMWDRKYDEWLAMYDEEPSDDNH